MNDFDISELMHNNVQSLYLLRGQVWLSPPYQRVSDIWPLDKQQLLIDTILNGFDVPKLYLHQLTPPQSRDGRLCKYAVIDGKQRLDAIWSFIDGKFALPDDFEYLHASDVKAAGMTYAQLAEKYPDLKVRFDSAQLTTVVVRTSETELIEEMFSRLNEAVPLNAPEKRNAFGGPLPPVIRDLAYHDFFTKRIPFEDKRYKYRDLSAKFLLIENENAVVDTKKVYLDKFVRTWAEGKRTELEASELAGRARVHLDEMARVFSDEDPLLRSIGMTIVLFHFFRLMALVGAAHKIKREHFLAFDTARTINRDLAATDITTAEYDLIEFEKLVQSPNDGYATRFRLAVLARYLRRIGFKEVPAKHDYFQI